MKNIHMMGIGGIGMSAIAKLLIEQGNRVSGCDCSLNSLTKKLNDIGAIIYKGHNQNHIDNSVDLVVRSSAIKEDHPELLKAKENSIPIYRRAQMLDNVIGDRKAIAVTGTHGKTTTSFMITHIMNYAGLNPSFAIGGEINKLGGNAHWGSSKYFVLEADESDGTQVYIKPHIAVITNIDCDHMEYYSGISHIAEIMNKFVSKIPENGLVLGYGGDPEIKKIFKNNKANKLTYGWDSLNDIYPGNLVLDAWGLRFDLWYKGKKHGNISLNIPGRHNVLNAMASIGVCIEIGIPFNQIASALDKYPGVKRRLDIVYKNNGITVIDDYAHHPNEIRAVISAVKNVTKNRIIGVFQPHRFTRTKFLKTEFGGCFAGLDRLILTDIYSAGEIPIEGITGRLIYDEVVKFGNPETVYIESKDDIPGYLLPQIKKGDTVVFMGAGDITEIAHNFNNQKVLIYD